MLLKCNYISKIAPNKRSSRAIGYKGEYMKKQYSVIQDIKKYKSGKSSEDISPVKAPIMIYDRSKKRLDAGPLIGNLE